MGPIRTLALYREGVEERGEWVVGREGGKKKKKKTVEL